MSSQDSGGVALARWIVVGVGRGELFEISAPDAMAAVRQAFRRAGGGGALFDIVTGASDRGDILSIYGASAGQVTSGGSFDEVERLRLRLLAEEKPELRCRNIAEAPLVMAALVPFAIERYLDGFSATESVRRQRRNLLVERLEDLVSPYQGRVVTETSSRPEVVPSPLVRLHARGVSLFALLRLARSFQETAVTTLSSGLAPADAEIVRQRARRG